MAIKLNLRTFCSSVRFNRQEAPSGLRFIRKFLDNQAQEQLLTQSLLLHREIERIAQNTPGTAARTYLSKQHNLKTDEHYHRVTVKMHGQMLNLQHFFKYGEEGHTLTYFIGTQNIPQFVIDALIIPMEQIEEVKELKAQKIGDKPLGWNLTFNTYKPSLHKRNQMPGFDFHKDIPSNGDITAIFTLLSEADVEMKPTMHSPVAYRETLIPGSLFLLSGAARWEWLHCVQPKDIPFIDSEKIRRVSLVLGCY
jgi:alkylated DNA repair dioxygenase AlkB